MSQASLSQPSTREAIKERFGHWPRLSRFYGFAPDELAHMPRWLVWLYSEYMEPIRAEEQLASLQVAGYPHLEKQYQRNRIITDLEKIADRIRKLPEPELPESDEAYMAAVMSAGVPISILDKDGNPIPIEEVTHA